VILTFTDGQIDTVSSGVSANGTTTTVFDSIRNLNVLVQIYSFDRLSSGSNPLSQLACDCYGTYEKISKTVANPLWTLRSYFGVLARIRLTAVNNTPAWTPPYQDNGSLGKVITAVYPAFADNYTLIGVAGIDVLIEELGSIVQSDFSTALVSHSNTDSLTGLVPPRLPCNVSILHQCPEKFLGIIDRDPSVSKCNWLHVVTFRFSFINLRCIFHRFLKSDRSLS
jgi:hypothetical protein